MKYLDFVSAESLAVIEANECHSQIGSIATNRFRRLFNEIDDLNDINKRLYEALAKLVDTLESELKKQKSAVQPQLGPVSNRGKIWGHC